MEMIETRFRIEQMDCPTEERIIRAALGGMEGVGDLEFNLIARTLTVRHEPGRREAIVRKIGGVGMSAVPEPGPDELPVLQVIQPSFWRKPVTITTAIALICAFAAEVLSWLPTGEGSVPVLVLAALAIVIGGYHTATKAWHSLRTLTLNIHFLMILAVAGAVVLQHWTEAGMVIALFAIAELVEAQSLARARRAIHSLMETTPTHATVMRHGEPHAVPVEGVALGEIVRIKPGERLPLDGTVNAGSSSVNQAPITGEAMPVPKGLGDAVFAGSINGSGTIDYEVTHTAAESTINRIADMVEQATTNRGRTERFVDRFARYYTPSVFGMAVAVAILPPLLAGADWSTWAYNALVLLVIGCPCALVLSTPVTIVSGLANAARHGILVKGGEILERGRDLRAIAFDKTGTLTEARPRVTDVLPMSDIAPDHLLHLAAAVEARSEHPIAHAIVVEHAVRHEGEREIAVADFEALPGRGARGLVEGITVFVGNHRLAHDLDVCSPLVEEHLHALERQGKTTVVVMTEENVIGLLGVADAARASSGDAVRQLRAMGLHLAILTGDNAITTASIADPLGIDDVHADLLPADKISVLRAIDERLGGPVGMVGEGVNDAPALAHASVGFVMGAAGSDVALEAADVALMDDDLLKLPTFLRLSHQVIAIMKQNIWIALGLKAVFFVLAMFGEATLWMAVFADMGASLIVVGNGLRMLRK